MRLAPTLREAAEAWLALQRPKWKEGAGTETLIRQRLDNHAGGLMGRRVDMITRRDVLAALSQVTKVPTRKLTLRYLASVFDLAILREWRADNPADAAVRDALPTARRRPQQHLASLDVADIPATLAKVEASVNWPLTALAIRFVALTVCRSAEGRGARWDEIDREAREWTIPGERMKSGRPFVVTLSAAALRVLDLAADHAEGGEFVFPNSRGGPLWRGMLSKPMEGTGGTIHGFRASFRTWAAEAGEPREVSEMALAHALGKRHRASRIGGRTTARSAPPSWSAGRPSSRAGRSLLGWDRGFRHHYYHHV